MTTSTSALFTLDDPNVIHDQNLMLEMLRSLKEIFSAAKDWIEQRLKASRTLQGEATKSKDTGSTMVSREVTAGDQVLANTATLLQHMQSTVAATEAHAEQCRVEAHRLEVNVLPRYKIESASLLEDIRVRSAELKRRQADLHRSSIAKNSSRAILLQRKRDWEAAGALERVNSRIGELEKLRGIKSAQLVSADENLRLGNIEVSSSVDLPFKMAAQNRVEIVLATITGLRKELSDHIASLTASQRERDDLLAQAADLDNAIMAVEADCVAAAQALARVGEESAALQADVQAARADYSQLAQDTQAQVDARVVQHKTGTTRVEEAEAVLAAQEDLSASLASVCEENKRTLQSLKQAVEVLRELVNQDESLLSQELKRRSAALRLVDTQRGYNEHMRNNIVAQQDILQEAANTLEVLEKELTASGKSDALFKEKIRAGFVDLSNAVGGAAHWANVPRNQVILDMPSLATVLMRGREGPRVLIGSHPTRDAPEWKARAELAGFKTQVLSRNSVTGKEEIVDPSLICEINRECHRFDRNRPGSMTVVILTGDGNDRDGWSNFFETAQMCAERGIRVAVYSWRACLSSNYTRLARQRPHLVSVTFLDDSAVLSIDASGRPVVSFQLNVPVLADGDTSEEEEEDIEVQQHEILSAAGIDVTESAVVASAATNVLLTKVMPPLPDATTASRVHTFVNARTLFASLTILHNGARKINLPTLLSTLVSGRDTVGIRAVRQLLPCFEPLFASFRYRFVDALSSMFEQVRPGDVVVWASAGWHRKGDQDDEASLVKLTNCLEMGCSVEVWVWEEASCDKVFRDLATRYPALVSIRCFGGEHSIITAPRPAPPAAPLVAASTASYPEGEVATISSVAAPKLSPPSSVWQTTTLVSLTAFIVCVAYQFLAVTSPKSTRAELSAPSRFSSSQSGSTIGWVMGLVFLAGMMVVLVSARRRAAPVDQPVNPTPTAPSPTATQVRSTPCRYYATGSCRNGANCQFGH